MSYKFIYFDLDDTLLDHKSAEIAALQDVHRQFSLFADVTPEALTETYQSVNSKQWSLYSRGKVTREQLQRNRFELTLNQLRLDETRYNEVGSFYMQCYRNHWQWIDGAQKAYQQILAEFPVGILTNGFAETQKLKFKKFDLYDSADQVVISEEVGTLKPDPKVFQHATELTGVTPDDILYVGDSLTSDIEGGTNFGWDAAWFTTNGDPNKHPKAEIVFDNFEVLTEFLEV